MLAIHNQKFIKIIVTLALPMIGGIFLFVAGFRAAPIAAAPTELFFSEYIEGSGNNKALEIFNGTGTTIDLSAYSVELYSNGSATPSQSVNLSGSLDDGDVFVLAHGSAADPIISVADLIDNAVVNFNGDDAIVLSKNGAIIDVIGQMGTDPGTKWGDHPTSTQNNTLRRKFFIDTGDFDGSDPFDPAIEWAGLAIDTFDGLGWHSTTPPPLTIVINEVAWAGTAASSNDEWIELYNPGTDPVNITNWILTGNADGQPINITLDGVIPATGYFLLERQDDNSVFDLAADLIYPFNNGLDNNGEILQLKEPAGAIIDTANGDGGPWPGGTNSTDGYKSMERIDPLLPDSDSNWQSNDTVTQNGQDTDGSPLNGTPKQANSSGASPPPPPPAPLTIVLNEIAWSGTVASANDEWIELLNTTTQTLTLDGWVITSTNGLNIPLDGTVIGPNAFYLIERTDDSAILDITAELTTSFSSGLVNTGDTLYLSANGTLIDTANGDGGPWPAGTDSTDSNKSMERIDPLLPDSDSNWQSNDTITKNGQDKDGNPINGTPKQANSSGAPLPPPPPPPPSAPLLISEFLYDGATPNTEGDEFVELCNPNTDSLDLTGYKVGDEETSGGGESMYRLPDGKILAAGDCVVIAKNAQDFENRFGFLPDLETSGLSKYTVWGSGSWSLANTGDELIVLGPNDEILDSVAYRNGNYAALALEPDASAPEPDSLQRVWSIDTGSMPHDFVRTTPNPGQLTEAPPPPPPAPPAALADGMNAYWGDLHSHTTYSDGAGPPHYALAKARAAGLHFYAITDHGWWLTPAEWASTLTQTISATIPGQFVALRGLEWSHSTAGHINIFNSDTLLSRTDPMFDDLSDIYAWLADNPDAIAQFNHPDPSFGGTFNNFSFNPKAARQIFMQEIGNSAQEYTTYEPSFVQSNAVGWRVAPTNNSDIHTAGWGAQTSARTGLVAPALTEADLLDAMRARRVFATEDSNLALALRVDGSWMGSVLATSGPMALTVDFVDPDPEPLTLFLYDSNLLLATVPFTSSTGQWSTTVEARPGHYFWAKVVQADGNTAYSAPVWIKGQVRPETIYINEILPAPHDWDWDKNGIADHNDEWVELFNPLDRPVGLGGWRLADASGLAYDIPLGVSIPAGGFITFYQAQTNFALNNGGDTVTLIHPNGTPIDTVTYTHSPGYDESWCRLPNDGPTWSDDCGPSPNTANWEQPPAGPLHPSIYEAKRLTPGAWVKIKGRVTAPPGVLGGRNMYIQDETAGILIYLPKDHGHHFNLGDKVEVEGNLRTFYEEFEIAVSERSDVKFLEAGTPPPPLPIATTSLLEPYEGRLVMLQGQAVQFKGRTTLWIDDGTGWAQTYIRQSTGIKKPFIEIGTPVTAVGIVSQRSDKHNPSRNDYRLLLRYQSDLILPELAPPNWPTLLPETGKWE